MIGIEIKPTIGVGDALQYSSLPENFFMATGKKLLDVSRPWFFDFNPFVMRDSDIIPNKTVQMWNFSPTQYQWPDPRKDDRPKVYLSNAEIWCGLFNIPCHMNRMRLYRFEDYPFHDRKDILLQTSGKSHGDMPPHIVEHVINKYGGDNLIHIGPGNNYGIKSYGMTETLWDLAEIISKARMLIGVDSAPAWIASCFPDVIVKKVRTKPFPDVFENWVPLEQRNIHSHWDSREHMIYNPTERDLGFTWSYKRI